MVNSDVNKYVEKFDGEKKKIVTRLRKIILKTFPGVREEIKWGVLWYDMLFYLRVQRDHVNLGFAFGGLLKNSDKVTEGTGKYMRHIKIYSVRDIDEKKFVRLMKEMKREYERCQEEKR
jgi:hypothetical protein